MRKWTVIMAIFVLMISLFLPFFGNNEENVYAATDCETKIAEVYESDMDWSTFKRDIYDNDDYYGCFMQYDWPSTAPDLDMKRQAYLSNKNGGNSNNSENNSNNNVGGNGSNNSNNSNGGNSNNGNNNTSGGNATDSYLVAKPKVTSNLISDPLLNYPGLTIYWNDGNPSIQDQDASAPTGLFTIGTCASFLDGTSTCVLGFQGRAVSSTIDFKTGDMQDFFNATKQVLINSSPFQTADGASIVFDESSFGGVEAGKTDNEAIIQDSNNNPNSSTYVPSESVTETKDCLNSGAASSLGWIVCSVLDFLVSSSNTLYNSFLEPALQIQPELFTGNSNTSTFAGWQTFQNVGNGLMIILLLVVIFSQVTGVGIDNYGIKKTLPKIIVAAILMNLSYWICVAAVDLSNIIGNGIQQLFLGIMPPDIENATVAGESFGSGFRATAISVSALVAIGGGASAIWWLSSGELAGVLLALIVGAISILSGILTLFVILSARQAAVVVLVVLSPLAMVCYMLPNTKSLFDRWLKFMQSLLMVYPVAGTLVGGGNYVSALLLSTDMANSVFGAVTAMVAGIVPIFFIPSVLRKSLSMASDIGNKINGFGRGVGRRASGFVDRGVRGTEAFKKAQERRARMRGVEYAKRLEDRVNNRMGRRMSAADLSTIRSLSAKEAKGTITESEQGDLDRLRRKRVKTLSKREQEMLRTARDTLKAQDHRERENAYMSDNAYYRAQMRQQKQQDEMARADQMLYRVDDYEKGVGARKDSEREQQLLNTMQWSQNPDLVTGARGEGVLSRRQKAIDASDMSRTDIIEASKREQDINHIDKLEKKLMFNDAEFRKGRINELEAQRINTKESTKLFNNGDFNDAFRKYQAFQISEKLRNTSQYAGASGDRLLRGEAEKAAAGRRQKQLDLENWNDRQYRVGVAKHQEADARNALLSEVMHADTAFNTGYQNTQDVRRRDNFLNTREMANDANVRAEQNKGDVGREQRRLDVRNWTDAAFVEGTRQKQSLDADNSLENTKMYADAKVINAERTTADNAREMRAATAEVGVPVLTKEAAMERASSTMYAQEYRAAYDSIKGFSRDQLYNRVMDDMAQYNAHKNDANSMQYANRLAAGLQLASEKGMNKELLKAVRGKDVDGKSVATYQVQVPDPTSPTGYRVDVRNGDALKLDLSDSANENARRSDTMLAGALASINDIAISAYGKEVQKTASAGVLDFNDFVQGRGTALNSLGGVRATLRSHLDAKRQYGVNNINEDTEEIIFVNDNRDAVSPEAQVYELVHTRSGKVQTQIARALHGRTDFTLTSADLASLTEDILRQLDPKTFEAAAWKLADGSQASQQLLIHMPYKTKEYINNTFKGNIGGTKRTKWVDLT